MASTGVIYDSFDVGDVGYVPWAGIKELTIFSGPFLQYQKGALSTLWFGSGFSLFQEPGEKNDWSKSGFLIFNPKFRNNWGCSIVLRGGMYHEANTDYLSRGMNLSVWGNSPRCDLWFGGNINYSYNYRRDFLAFQANTYHGFYWPIIPRVSLEVNSNFWVEWDTTNTIIAVWPMATPRIDFTITPRMSFGIFNEFVLTTPGTDFGKTEFLSNRFGFLFTYNFKPKSWLYIALNDYRTNQNGSLRLQNQVGAVKVKYLVYF